MTIRLDGRPGLARRDGCPKRMVFGPCGGVRPGGRCEVDDRRCPFVDDPAPRWPGGREGTGLAVRAPVDPLGRAGTPLVVCDARPPEATLAAARALGRDHAGWCDAVLIGEHHDRVDLPGSVLAAAAIDGGARPWVTLTCRDRNAVAIEAELVACAAVGVREVHCVTGDARAPHVRPGSAPVFDLDSLRLTALARSFGLTVSVAESPLAEPTAARPGRAAEKSAAGASWCFVNVGVDAERTARFVAASRAAGSDLRYIGCVAVFTDEPGAIRLAALPGVALDDSAVRSVLHAADPVEAGIDRAVSAARDLLSVDGVEGVNLSGPASTNGDADRLAVMRAVAERLRTPVRPTVASTQGIG
jgi:5,10-methylenetetrahydrofolate reductase